MVSVIERAVRCPVCRLLVAPGDYGRLVISVTSSHEPVPDEYGIAYEAESFKSPRACQGSERLGYVVDVP